MPGKHRKNSINRFALWVAGGGKVSAWCKEHGVSAKTGYRWYKDDECQRMVEEYRRRAVDRAIGRMARSLGKAVEKIVDLISNGQTDAVKLSAAKALVEKLIDVQNHAELKSDLRRLDDRLDAQEKRRASGTAKAPKSGRPA
jgi:hypothetical protein